MSGFLLADVSNMNFFPSFQAKATHGGYLSGKISLPANKDDYVIQLSPAPSIESKQPIQPNQIHVTIMNETTRKSVWKSEMTAGHWRTRIRIRNGQAFLLQPNPLTGIEEELESPHNPIKCLADGGKTLLLGLGGLLLTIITPLQNFGRGNDNGVRLLDVLSDRIKCGQDVLPESTTAEALAEAYMNKKKLSLIHI